ncbi:Retrovirus-related Pol polyprotein from transposon TNT 1-94 [Vitis vinifera]|uniref:Retrovirus-related Pol polyprotein from transposon TNT 1-94 n=1 Tax=Vitis vinifera TaxID=29760 RepID=A0A438FD85_VITVI|nr:Retrovirus-related Pol polyprotein from transposon TNT 1-94 [Vitis vinifera]
MGGGENVAAGVEAVHEIKISAGIRGSIEQHENVRELLKAIDEQFVTSDKALAITLIMKFTSLKLTGIRGVREHIMEMRNIVAQLKKLEDSSTLWHRRLGHISIDRIKRLVNDGVLSTLDFTDFETCVDCIKGKQTNKSKRGATRSSAILEIIHTDICSLDMDSHGQKYFISFIDDFSRYMYLYILHNKNEALDAFKVFKAEVEKQCGKQIKIVRSDRGGEYYGRYLEDGQSPGHLRSFFKTWDCCPIHHAWFSRPKWCSRKKKPNFIGHGWKPSLRHMHVWGCSSEVRIYNPQEKKLDPRTISGYFIGYAEKSKGGSDQFRNIVSDIDHTESQPSTSSDRLFIVHNTPQVQSGVERTIAEVQPVVEVPQVVDNIPVDQVDQEFLTLLNNKLNLILP